MRDQVILNSSLSVNGWRAMRVSNVTITTTRSFSESRFARSPWPRKKYQIPFDALTQADRMYLLDFYDGRVGPDRSFLLWDRDENFVLGQSIGTGNGVQTQFQFGVTVGDATNNSFKPLWAPCPTGTAIPIELQGLWPGHASTFWTVTVGGVAQAEGANFTVNSANGMFTFSVAPPYGDTVVVTGWYFTVVRFDGPEFDVELDSIFGRVQPDMIEVFNE